MPLKEFWEDDPQLLWSYDEAYRLDIKQEETKLDTLSWLVGRYVLEACACMFDKNKKYPTKPMIYDKINKENNNKPISNNQNETARFYYQFVAWANEYNKQRS